MAKALITLMLLSVLIIPAIAGDLWTVLSFDAKGDGRDPSLADAAQLSYRYDKDSDFLWFRVSLYGTPNEAAFGVQIAINTGADDAAQMNWWGANKDFKFDKLVTALVTRTNGTDRGTYSGTYRGTYSGTMGVADVAGVKSKNFTNLRQDNLQIRAEGDSIIVGFKRTDVTDKMKMNLIAAVGSNEQWNDDIPDARSITLDLSAPRPTKGLRELDFSRNNFVFPPDYKTLGDNQPPVTLKKGTGREPLILIPGVYSGTEVFDGFIARNQAKYKLYLLTPRGLNETPARALPDEHTSFGEFTWTRRLERDILDLIHKEKLRAPIIVAHGFPGSLAADELAVQHPDLLGGIIDVAVMPVQFLASPRDPSWKRAATPAERIESVDESWAQKWFKYVTPETWDTNNYPVWMYSNDLDRGEKIRQQVEATILPVKIHYLAEFMASDHSSELASLNLPLLALRPGFNEQLLADPANSWYKKSFIDSWEPFSKNSHIQLLTIPDARALLLDDQPKLADDAIASFVDRLDRSRQHH